MVGDDNTRFTPFTFTEHDIIITKDDESILRDMGIAGRILVTPGHSHDSISLIMDDGRAFVGDAAGNFLSWAGTCKRPVFLNNEPQLLASWEKLITHKAQVVYPGHGKPFPREELQQCLHKLKEEDKSQEPL